MNKDKPCASWTWGRNWREGGGVSRGYERRRTNGRQRDETQASWPDAHCKINTTSPSSPGSPLSSVSLSLFAIHNLFFLMCFSLLFFFCGFQRRHTCWERRTRASTLSRRWVIILPLLQTDYLYTYYFCYQSYWIMLFFITKHRC